MRKTILIRGAREHNLKNIELEIPRDQLVVITGVSGSGKSSLAFDTLYAEGQRRLLESMSTYVRRFVSQLKKPEVGFITGLSPVVSIEQKTIGNNPRSTIGTMTDILDYLRMLYAVIGQPHCPFCKQSLALRSPYQIMEHLMSLPLNTEVEVRAPVLKVYGEDYAFLFDDIRTKGYRHARIDGTKLDLGEDCTLDEDHTGLIEVIVDQFVIGPDIDKAILAALEHGLKLGEGLLSFHITSKISAVKRKRFYQTFGCDAHRIVAGTMHYSWFSFNDPLGACATCSGLGDYLHPHPELLTPDKSRSLKSGAFLKEVFHWDKNSWNGRWMYSLAQHYGFSLDTPFEALPDNIVHLLFYGNQGEKFSIILPEGARQGEQHVGKKVSFQGFLPLIEQQYRWYRKKGESHTYMEDYLRKIMVEYACPNCESSRLKKQRRLVTIMGKNIYELGEMNLVDFLDFLQQVEIPAQHQEAGSIIIREITSRLKLLVDIGLDYLNLNRKSGTLSGGEAQRIRLSSQIGSGLMGMLYVLDEPSIGLHPKDNIKMIQTLKRLRDIGNTVIVVEHDEDTIRAADTIIEIGPGPGIHGGEVVAIGPLQDILVQPDSLTGQYLSKQKCIPLPTQRRQPNERKITITGMCENNLQNIDVEIPLDLFVCFTGASGSGKSTIMHEILYKKLYALLHDSRIFPGKHDTFSGHAFIDDVIHIDQSPIGRSPRSNPATYIGFYDHIRKLFAATESAKQRNYTASRFSFNVKGGRCEECSGAGTVTTNLSFMPDVEITCPTCKGKRYNPETLEITYQGLTIADILALSIEEGATFFTKQKLIARKLQVLNELGLGYLQIGHPATILSGGEAQRIKLASELSRIKRGKHNLYILDEPTTGLHTADIQRLLDCLNRLVDSGHSVLVIEHNLDVIKTADYIIDLGPEGGHKGGRVIARGTPEKITKCADSFTGQYLQALI